ncbi:bacteriochlorophyll 4-vinyl reductase [Pseudaestuariivita rosea]|uniref:bacteriochlorophyll 4-vinyl reductase n=1 Tax=Pseudaestuariivita rosea TaxID=2763263 RepID=UPI001ABB1BB1|nr:bacteriochlorophyll 4-vinyl reductase [Pseudaestuariivita rosea]
MDGSAHITQGVVGPNAVIQLGRAVEHHLGFDAAHDLFAGTGFAHLLLNPPQQMIDQAIPAALFHALWQVHPPDVAAKIAETAGLWTADYIIANRIPRFAKTLLRLAPRRLGAALLSKAIRKNAWTFAGSGRCHVVGHVIEIADNLLTMPGSVWHKAVLQRLFNRLIDADIIITHNSCWRDGTPVCRFTVTG